MAARYAGPEARSLLSTLLRLRRPRPARRPVRRRPACEVTTTRTQHGTARFPSVDAAVATEVNSTPLGERITPEVYEQILDGAREVLAPFTASDGTAGSPLRQLHRRRPPTLSPEVQAACSFGGSVGAVRGGSGKKIDHPWRRSPVGCSYGLDGFGWRAGGFGWSGGGVDDPAVGVGEHQPVRVVGVAGDAQQPLVMQSVVGGADAGQVPRVGRAAMFVVDDVMDLQPAGLGAPRHPTLAVPGQHDAPGPIRHRVLGAPDRDRQGAVGEHRADTVPSHESMVAQPVRHGQPVASSGPAPGRSGR